MSVPHRQRRIASLELDDASDIEREAKLLVERVNRRMQELRDQRSAAGGMPSPPGGNEGGDANAAEVDPPRQPPGG
jgi:hypothetical protein